MTSIDDTNYLSNGGYLQKGRDKNLTIADLSKREVHDLLPGRYFRDPKIYELERRAIFSKLWHVASFTARFKTPGDYLSLDMFGWSFFLIKDKDGQIKAYHNICRHRGHPVITKPSGNAPILTCRFHGWTYLPDGTLHRAKHFAPSTNPSTNSSTPGIAGFNAADHSLFPIHVHITAQGFIFINFDAGNPPHVSFTDQFGDDFSPLPSSSSPPGVSTPIDEYALLPTPPQTWTYDHTWTSTTVSTTYNWKTFADGFQECYHCQTGHPTTLPKDFRLDQYYLRQGFGASRHFLPAVEDKAAELGESYITWLYPIGAIIFSQELLMIARFDARGVLETGYQSETYRRSEVPRESEQWNRWMERTVGYWRFVEREDVELAVAAQRGLMTGVLGKGRVGPVHEHAVKWYQDKVRASLLEHAEMEQKLGKKVDYSIPQSQGEYDEQDPVCRLIDAELDW